MFNIIQKTKKNALILMAVGFFTGALIMNCTHKDEILITKGPNITRGDLRVTLTDVATAFDKVHSNVNWSTPYDSATANLTGRFNNFGFYSFYFSENNKDSIKFDSWVYINTVNTGEPGRDYGCLQGTFGVDTTQRNTPANVAELKSKSVEYSTTDNGYIVICDLTFHGQTREVTGKLKYAGIVSTVAGSVTKDVIGFSFEFQMNAKTDFAISSNSINDVVSINCNAIFKRTR